VAAIYLEYLANPGTKASAKEHLDWFAAHVGKIKVSDLRVHHVNDYLKTKSWSDSMKATAINRITSALTHAVGEGYIDEHKVKYARGKKPKYAGRHTREDKGLLWEDRARKDTHYQLLKELERRERSQSR
jgi:hypothetical protein